VQQCYDVVRRQPVLVSATSTSDFHTLCSCMGFLNALEAVADLGVAGLVGVYLFGLGVVFFPAAYIRPCMVFSFVPDVYSVILISCSPISLLWRGKGLYLQEVAISLEVEGTPWFPLRPSGTTWLLGSNIPVFFLSSLPVPAYSIWWGRTGLEVMK